MHYRIYEILGREEMKKIDRGITMINHTQAEAMGKLSNVLCQVGVTTIIAKFLILDIPIDRDAPIVVATRFDVLRTRTAESDSDDEEEYVIKRNKFGAPIYGPKIAPYLAVFYQYRRSIISYTDINWKPDYKGSYTKEEEATGQWHYGINNDEAGSSRSKRSRHETVEEVLLPQVYHEFLLWEGCNRDAKSKMGCDGEIDDMLRIKLCEAGSDEEIFTSVAWIRAFNINEPIYAELCHEFYSTYKFDEVCADDELQTKKIIKFRLGGRAHSLTLLEFARRLGLYQAVELEEEGFNVYFEGGLRSDEHFNAQDYWLRISREENLGLSRSHTSTIRNPILRVIHKMITYGLYQRTTGYDKVQKNDLWLLSIFDARHQNVYANIARKYRVLTEDVVRSLSAPIYYRDLDMITLRDLIDSEGKLIPEDPQPGVPRVGILRPPRASMQDLYDWMGRMEIRQEAIERIEYRRSYHWDMYQGVFEHMAGVYSVPL
ncbi:hypothetical protein Tco_1037573 [Tanacetum coccineum]